MKILIADDDLLSRRMLQSTLERAGYEVIAVEDGRAAADQLCKESGPRLALLDWMMPNLDGPTVVKEVRKIRSQPYVHMILLTSKQTKDDIVAGLGSGADDYLVKPFHPQELKARLHTGVRILQLEDKLVEAREEMRFRATHDALTGLWNRGMVMELLQREMNRTRREGGQSHVTLVLGDVDHFKQVNDTYGHSAGDSVLKEVAKRFQNAVRNYDVVSRYGGEEFLVLLSGCNTQNACERAEQMRHVMESSPVTAEGHLIRVSMSLGIASTQDWPNLEGDALIREADLALYHAKHEGRNQCALAQRSGFQVLPRLVHVSENAIKR